MKLNLVMSFVIGACVMGDLVGRDIDLDNTKERYGIDTTQSTLIVFPDAASLALGAPNFDLEPLSEGDAGNIWKLSPHCGKRDKSCHGKELDLEFVLVSGKHVFVKLKTQEDIKDHVISVVETPTFANLDATRQRLVPLARQTFLRVVKKWPPLPKAEEEEIPESIKKFAKEWTSFRTDQLVIHVGSASEATRENIEKLNDSSILLIGFYDESIVTIRRRKP